MPRSLMVQGTMSGVGKSLLAAGLCRVFMQDGYAVAPFKSQNMALNSFVTSEGLEMGRAQVMQAEAAGVEPSVLMNPVLLKPTSETGSQVIVHGEVCATMSAREYVTYKASLMPEVLRAYAALSCGKDIIVLEGAGSPAEINLKEHDIVNMGLALRVRSPVLLVGDIDRGGVFAQLLGTLALLEPEERALVRGLIINKFRGDKDLLQPGVAMLEQKAGVPVLGVVPYMPVRLDDEDSQTSRLYMEHEPAGDCVDIAVIRFPHIANFSDFTLLAEQPGVCLRYVEHAAALGNPDMLILPGTKNTLADLHWLRAGGWEPMIRRRAASGGLIVGICGGFQMLGRAITDSAGMENAGGMSGRGLELLPVDTEFGAHKVRTQVAGRLAPLPGVLEPLGGLPVAGYEIHMGEPAQAGGACFANVTDVISGTRKQDGVCAGNVYGTYIHGLFDSQETTSALVALLSERKGIPAAPSSRMTYRQFKEREYNAIADCLRENMDMERIYAIIHGGQEA